MVSGQEVNGDNLEKSFRSILYNNSTLYVFIRIASMRRF